MPRESPTDLELALLRDMLDSARLAIEHLGDATEDNLSSDLFLQDAVVRRVIIIGEAARQIPRERRAALVDLPWPEIVGMRSVLAHDYGEVDPDVLWATVHQSLPNLLVRLEQFFSGMTKP